MTWTGIIFLAVGCNNYGIGGGFDNMMPTHCPDTRQFIGTYDSPDACIKAVRAIVDKPQIKAISGGECSARVGRP